jgi:hypothetical protein
MTAEFTDDPDWDAKYIVFKREDFEKHVFGEVAYAQWEVKDAVVIRRQDKFASPCLATYAAMIGLVASESEDPKKKAQLLAISDYFERQAQLAAEEGWKLPDL